VAPVAQVVHLSKGRGFLKPPMQLESANAEWIFAVLPGPCAKPSNETENALTLTLLIFEIALVPVTTTTPGIPE
jgi:hypothetical protein